MANNYIIDMVNADLQSLKKIYNVIYDEDNVDYTDNEVDELFKKLDHDLMSMKARYSSLINDFPDDINLEISDEEMGEEIFVRYLKNVIEKLETFKNMGYSERNNGVTVVTTNNITQTNNNTIDLNISFQEAKQNIERISSLPDSEIKEILQKIDELESIIKSNDRKSKKWEKAKQIAKWILDKGFDIVKIVLPLVLKIDQN